MLILCLCISLCAVAVVLWQRRRMQHAKAAHNKYTHLLLESLTHQGIRQTVLTKAVYYADRWGRK